MNNLIIVILQTPVIKKTKQTKVKMTNSIIPPSVRYPHRASKLRGKVRLSPDQVLRLRCNLNGKFKEASSRVLRRVFISSDGLYYPEGCPKLQRMKDNIRNKKREATWAPNLDEIKKGAKEAAETPELSGVKRRLDFESVAVEETPVSDCHAPKKGKQTEGDKISQDELLSVARRLSGTSGIRSVRFAEDEQGKLVHDFVLYVKGGETNVFSKP